MPRPGEITLPRPASYNQDSPRNSDPVAMTFLAVVPWVGWTLLVLTLLTITIIFFLRIRHRQVVVSSALLWDRVLEKRRRRSWMELLRRLISLLIALLIGGSLVLAFTEAELGGAGEPRRITLVIDNGLTMATRTPDGSTRLEVALGRARAMLSRGSGADRFTVTDRVGRAIAPASRDRALALEALDDLRVTAAPLRVPAVEPGGETWLITDGVGLDAAPPGVELLSVYAPADNVGVSGFEIRAVPTDAFVYEAFLEVGNFSAEPRQAQIELIDGAGVQFRRAVELRPNEFYRNTFDLSPLTGGALEARVTSEGDDYPLDDRAWIYLPRRRNLRVALVGDGDAVAEVLAQESHVQVERMSMAGFEQWSQSTRPGGSATAGEPVEFDGFIFVAAAPAIAPPGPALLLGAPPVDWLPTAGPRVEEPGAVTFEGEHPVLQFVDLHDLRVDAAMRIEPGDARVLLAAGDLPLLVASSGEAEWLLTTFSLSGSDLRQSLAFPILLSNLLDWWRSEAPMIRHAPGRVTVPVAGAVIAGDEGTVADVRSLPGRTLFTATEPGLYFARTGRRTIPVAVVLADREFSAVNRTLLADPERGSSPEPPLQLLWPALLALAAALLIVEGITYHRRITV